jgi:hypothetical protein
MGGPLGPIALGAYAATPLFLKNENRGYFRTSLITTPILYAGFTAAPTIFNAGVGSVSNWRKFAFGTDQAGRKAWNFSLNRGLEYNYPVFRNMMEQGILKGKTMEGLLNQAAKLWYSGIKSPGMRGVNEEQLMEVFNRLAGDEKKLGLLNYAVEGARNKSLSLAESAKATASRVLQDRTSSELLDIVKSNISNERFTRELMSRMRRAEELRGATPGSADAFIASILQDEVKAVPLDRTAALKFMERDAGYKPTLEALANLESKRPSEYLNNTILMGYTNKAGEIESIAGLQFRGKSVDDILNIGIVNPKTRLVNYGKNFNLVGIGRKIGDHTRDLKGDAYLINMLSDEIKHSEIEDLIEKTF